MFRPPLSNPTMKRSLRPLYANHQATPYGGFLDPEWDRSFDIYPGTVMARAYGEVFTPFTGANGQVPFGLSALFDAPSLSVEEVTGSGTNLFTVWVGDSQAVFEILAPAFDPDCPWSFPAGSQVFLTGDEEGRLTTEGVDADNAIAELIEVVSADKIIVRLNRINASVNSGGS